MKIHKTLIVIVAFVCALSIGSILNTTSEYKFPKDTKLGYKVSNEITQTMTMMGQEQSNAITSSEKMYILSLGLVDDNNFKVEFYIDDVNIKADNPQINLDGVDFSFITNKKSSALVSKKGVVSSVEEVDVVEFPEDQILRSVTQQYNPAVLFSRFFLVLPEKELKVGESWEDTKTETNDDIGGEMAIVNEFSYTVLEALEYNGYNCFKIDASSKMSYLGQGAQMGQEFKVSGSGKGTATFYFAHEEGILVGYEVYNSSDINMDFTAMDMTIPMVSTLSSKVELIK